MNNIVKVVGKDNRLHFWNIGEAYCLCGEEIKSKKIKRDDISKRYWCHECDTLINEERYSE